MCLSKHSLVKDFRSTANISTFFHNLHHTIISDFSKERHKTEKTTSNLFFTTTLASPSRSVFIASRATAHTEKFACWIDRKYYSVLSCIPLSKRLKCTGTTSYQKDFKMVWISNLDNPKVNLRMCQRFLLEFNQMLA